MVVARCFLTTTIGFQGKICVSNGKHWGFKGPYGICMTRSGVLRESEAWQNVVFATDSDPPGSKSGSEGIPWQLFSSRISWQAPNPAMMSKMDRNIKGFGSGFSDFSDFPQMENRDLGWIGLGLGSPKTLFSTKKHRF